MVKLEFNFIPLTMTKGIYYSGSNMYMECQDNALYLNELHKMVNSYGCPNSMVARVPILRPEEKFYRIMILVTLCRAHIELRFLLYVCTGKILTFQLDHRLSIPFANHHLKHCYPLLPVFGLSYKCNCAIVSRFPSNVHPVIPHLSLNVALFC